MKDFWIIIFYVLGLVIGSFCSLVAYRLSNGKSIVKPRSYCEGCNRTLKWYEMIPILSYIALGGRCRRCNSKISIFYPVSELFLGVLFAVCFYKFGFSYKLFISLGLSSLFIITLITDLNYYIIPDEVNIFFAIYFFIVNIFGLGFSKALIYEGYGLIMFSFMYFLMLLGNHLFKEESLGGGDIKLLFVLGSCVPILVSFVGVTVGALIALPLSIFIFIKNKDKAIPFGPFLVLSFLLLYLFRVNTDSIIDLLKLL